MDRQQRRAMEWRVLKNEYPKQDWSLRAENKVSVMLHRNTVVRPNRITLCTERAHAHATSSTCTFVCVRELLLCLCASVFVSMWTKSRSMPCIKFLLVGMSVCVWMAYGVFSHSLILFGKELARLVIIFTLLALMSEISLSLSRNHCFFMNLCCCCRNTQSRVRNQHQMNRLRFSR